MSRSGTGSVGNATRSPPHGTTSGGTSSPNVTDPATSASPDVSVQLVLDTSALLAYCHPDLAIHVGEPLAICEEDEDAQFAVPAVCLGEAVRNGAGEAMLQVLTGRDSCVIAPLRRGDWPAFGRDAVLLDRLDLAAATVVAAAYRAPILSQEWGRYPGDFPVISIGP